MFKFIDAKLFQVYESSMFNNFSKSVKENIIKWNYHSWFWWGFFESFWYYLFSRMTEWIDLPSNPWDWAFSCNTNYDKKENALVLSNITSNLCNKSFRWGSWIWRISLFSFYLDWNRVSWLAIRRNSKTRRCDSSCNRRFCKPRHGRQKFEESCKQTLFQ